ncbi:unnamed protein product [Enterobius vermicularis]|uniref:DUF4200 domain-containing protein n=1 Tax=Enterobius vermicularis TaxID=51028 RepID=A0A0N4UZ54_ENTVE|nr:unnamed protein product [Enterobius vermicularis]
MNRISSPYDTYIARYYTEKINEKKAELEDLHAGKHKQWAIMKAGLSMKYKEHVSFYEAADKLEKERIAAEFEREQKAADSELEERLAELLDSLIQFIKATSSFFEFQYSFALAHDLVAFDDPNNKKMINAKFSKVFCFLHKNSFFQECEEQKKQAKHEFNNCDIASTSGYAYPASKKSLRRRPNELPSYSEKRMRSKNPQQVVFQLPETMISDDLEFVANSIEKAERSNTPDSNSRSSISQ